MTLRDESEIELMEKRLTKNANYIIAAIHSLERNLDAPVRICWVLSVINLGFLLFLCTRFWG